MTKPDAYPYAHRLALELECLLLECKDTAAVSKWWNSALEALEQWREFCRESLQDAPAPCKHPNKVEKHYTYGYQMHCPDCGFSTPFLRSPVVRKAKNDTR